jgi:predicted nicotinamide N-methyase
VSAGTIADPQGFILANTRLQSPPHTPELSLYLADEVTPIWRLTEEELGEIGLPPPFWAFAWAGGQALARYLLDNPALVAGHRVLDLGSGSGLTAIAAMRAGAAHVLAADIDALALEAIALNAQANGVAVATTCADLLAAPPAEFDTILVGDLFYERPMAERVLAFIGAAQARNAVILVGDPRRSYFPKERFVLLAEYAVPVTLELEDAEIKHTAVWRPAPDHALEIC